jgi:sec-independent protein translocase protein TatA
MLAFFNLGGGEIILILAIVLILFGAKKLPELAKGLGQGIKEFKKATHNASEGMREAMAETLRPCPGVLLRPESPLLSPNPQLHTIRSAQTPDLSRGAPHAKTFPGCGMTVPASNFHRPIIP